MSASSMMRYAKCPASFLRGRWMPDTTSEAAERGNRIHYALHKQDSDGLEHDEALSAERCNDIVQTIIHDVLSKYIHQDDPPITSREERVQSFAGTRRYSGQWDLTHYWQVSKVALVADYKTGPRGAAPAEKNYQLASLADLAAQRYRMPDDVCVYVALVTPLKSPQYSIAKYQVKDLAAIRDALAGIAEAAHDPYAPAVAGEHCRYCPARTACSERNEIVGEVATVDSPASITAPGAFADLLNKGDLAASAHKEHREIAKRLMVEGRIEIPGWKIQETKGRETIKPEPLMDRMSEEGYLTKMLGTMVSVTKKGLTAVVRTKTGLAGKALEEEVNRLLEGCKIPGKPSQKLVKE